MDEGGIVPKLSRKELRKQKLMEFLAAKGKLKPANPKPYLRDDLLVKKAAVATTKTDPTGGKENQAPAHLPAFMKNEDKKIQISKAALRSSDTLNGVSRPKREGVGTLPALPGAMHSIVPKGPTQPVTIDKKPATTRALKSNISANDQPRKHPNMAAALSSRPSSGQLLSNATRTSQSNRRPNSASTSRPLTSTSRPLTSTSRPLTSTSRPLTSTSRPLTSTSRPLTSTSRPLTSTSRPMTSVSRPLMSASRPLTSASRPLTSTDCVWMSLGPIAKTKTGLLPAVLHPKNTPSHTTTFPAATVTTSTASMVNRARSAPTVVAHKSAVDQGKTRPSTSVNRPVRKSTAAGTVNTRVKVSAQSKTDSKPLAGKPAPRKHQPSCRSRAPAPRKPTHVPSRPTFATVKTGEKKRAATAAKPVVQPAKTAAPQLSVVRGPGKASFRASSGPGNARPKTAASQLSVVRGPGNARPWKASFRASSGPGNAGPWKASFRASSGPGTQWQATALNRAVQAAVSEPGQTDNIPRGTGVKEGDDSTKVPPSQAGNKGTGIVSVPMTVPRSSKSTSQVAMATAPKTAPRAQSRIQPQTGENKSTAAQEDRMRKLQEWREAKGISYKRPPMPAVKPHTRSSAALLLPQPYWASLEEEDQAHSLMCAVDTSLADCIKLLREGCPPEQVKDVLSRLPAVAQKFAKYWICRVRLMEHQGELEVLPVFEEAVRVVLEPVDELRTVVFEILKKKKNESQGHPSVCGQAEREEISAEGDQSPGDTGNQSPGDTGDPMVTPKPVKVFICDEKRDSSVIKYKITATPGGFRSQQREPVRVNGQEVRFFTPVRRSVRIERSSLRYPASLQDHDLCVTSHNHLMAEEERGGEERGDASPSVQDTPTMYVYRENEALEDRVMVQLVYEDA